MSLKRITDPSSSWWFIMPDTLDDRGLTLEKHFRVVLRIMIASLIRKGLSEGRLGRRVDKQLCKWFVCKHLLHEIVRKVSSLHSSHLTNRLFSSQFFFSSSRHVTRVWIWENLEEKTHFRTWYEKEEKDLGLRRKMISERRFFWGRETEAKENILFTHSNLFGLEIRKLIESQYLIRFSSGRSKVSDSIEFGVLIERRSALPFMVSDSNKSHLHF